MNICFDIESCALSEAELLPFMPQEADMKLGNVKDPEKRATAVCEKQRAWLNAAALDPMTGRVLAIGLLIQDTFVLISEPASEAQMLHEFWDAIQDSGSRNRLIGFDCNRFDLPFLIKRSWKLGVSFPEKWLREGRYWSKQITDLREVWQCGDRQADGSLDTIAKHLGVGSKTGSGADFGKLWLEDRDRAIAYLRNDLELTQKIAQRIGVLALF